MLQKVKVFGLFLLLATTGCRSVEKPVEQAALPAEVQVLATVHKFHLSNPNYPYAKVTQQIQKFGPDIIAIEIRPEDLQEDTTYLKQFYPLEMRQVLKDFPREKVRGLDWYGEEMRGKKMPADVFKNEQTELGKIKKLEREMNRDSLLQPRLIPLAELSKQQVELAKTASPAILNNGQYDDITRTFYEVLDEAVKGTRYETYTQFNRRRDEIITENIVKLVQNNPGKRILVLLGANHRNRAIHTLEKLPAEKVRLVEVED
ncbi:hypothetical protein I5M27_12135 [Adhaeribacter sp. BT258]|uniref:Haem-binding uptake Tiki superfamily ChaN domain-containing protein n=1 Tax=Adhaeribacter terrigena TaxID=2793070 RepID=A0ABS1C328_9BACT|nr:hypothetical protein [Adhaeribacter terrigena]MBK0403740.1 hypothetical protein [Adhaeribacter terrigena]